MDPPADNLQTAKPLQALDEIARPAWERTLLAIDHALDESPVARAGVALGWRVHVVDEVGVEVTPWLQKLGKKGQLGVPALIGRRHLLMVYGAKLAPEDARVAALLPEREGFAPRALLDALIDHPRVVLRDAPHREVRIDRAPLGLVAEERHSAVRVSVGVEGTALHKSLAERARKARPEDVLFLWDGQRLTLLDVKAELKALLDVLLRDGNVFPPESRVVLLQSLAKWAQHLPVTMPRSVMGESVAARALRADFKFALSGTPIENHTGEIWSLFTVVFPGLLGAWSSFRDRYATPIEKQTDPAAAPALSRVLAPFLLRRTKLEVETELPARTEVRVPVVLSSAESQLYEDARLAALSDLETLKSKLKEQERRIEVLAALTRLRLLASHPRLYDPRSKLVSSKLTRLLELVEELRAEGQRPLVFSQFTSHLALVREALDARGIDFVYLDGQTPQAARRERVRSFQEGTAPLFLISLKAGGAGINLTAATNPLIRGVGCGSKRRVKRIAPTLFGVAVLVAALPARADFETWLWAEARVPVITAPAPAFPRLDWRVFTDVRMNVRSGGLSQLFFRTGPLLYVSRWMFIGLHGTIYADRLGKPAGDLEAGDFAQEARVELEPNLFWRLGDFTFNDRNRLEYRWREHETRYRYRNQLRVNYAPRGAVWIPFLWNELLVDLSGKGVNQNRFDVGVGRMLNAHTRLDLGFMVRSRKEDDGWKHDGILNLYVFLDVPPQAPTTGR